MNVVGLRLPKVPWRGDRLPPPGDYVRCKALAFFVVKYCVFQSFQTCVLAVLGPVSPVSPVIRLLHPTWRILFVIFNRRRCGLPVAYGRGWRWWQDRGSCCDQIILSTAQSLTIPFPKKFQSRCVGAYLGKLLPTTCPDTTCMKLHLVLIKMIESALLFYSGKSLNPAMLNRALHSSFGRVETCWNIWCKLHRTSEPPCWIEEPI